MHWLKLIPIPSPLWSVAKVGPGKLGFPNGLYIYIYVGPYGEYPTIEALSHWKGIEDLDSWLTDSHKVVLSAFLTSSILLPLSTGAYCCLILLSPSFLFRSRAALHVPLFATPELESMCYICRGICEQLRAEVTHAVNLRTKDEYSVLSFWALATPDPNSER